MDKAMVKEKVMKKVASEGKLIHRLEMKSPKSPLR